MKRRALGTHEFQEPHSNHLPRNQVLLVLCFAPNNNNYSNSLEDAKILKRRENNIGFLSAAEIKHA